MNRVFWSTALQWSRLGVNAVLFLVAARFLSLAEIGAFATAYAPLRLLQVVQKAGVVDAYIVSDKTQLTKNAFFFTSAFAGVIFAAALALLSLFLPEPTAPLMAVLSLIPLLHGVSAIHEGALRHNLRIKALALRTLFAQLLAAALALMALMAGWGAASLVVFALVNSVTSCLVSIALVRLPLTLQISLVGIRAILRDISRISVRELTGSATQPLMQLAVGAALGLPAAGAFQIAARMVGLFDALAISPIRYIALPRFVTLAGKPALAQSVLQSLRTTSLIASLVYLGALGAAADLLTLAVGASHAASAAPLLPAFCLLGLTGAVGMPLNQSLTAVGCARLTMLRSAATLALSVLLAGPALAHSAVAAAFTLPLAATVVFLVYARYALPRLGLEVSGALLAVAPALLCGLVMTVGLALVDASLQGVTPLVRLTLKAGMGVGIYGALLLAFNLLSFRPVVP